MASQHQPGPTVETARPAQAGGATCTLAVVTAAEVPWQRDRFRRLKHLGSTTSVPGKVEVVGAHRGSATPVRDRRRVCVARSGDCKGPTAVDGDRWWSLQLGGAWRG
jgi:hypothetical protein